VSSRIATLKQQFGALSKVDKTFSIALLVQIVYSLIDSVTGVQLPASGLVRVLFIIITIVFLIRSFPRLFRKLVWRVRHRLLVTWIFLGVVPIILIAALVVQGLYILMGQVAGYMTTTEIDRQSELVRSAAHALGWSVAHRAPSVNPRMLADPFVREMSETRHGEIGAVVRTGKDVLAVPEDSSIREIPEWSGADFVGLVKDPQRHYISAHVFVEGTAGRTEVFLYQHAPPEFFRTLLPDMATIQLLDLRVRTNVGGIDVRRTEGNESGISIRTRDPDFRPTLVPPPRRGWWDFTVNWLVPVKVTDLGTGKPEDSLVVVVSRPSLIVNKLFSTLGNLAAVAAVILVLLACALLVVEIISLILGTTLTRSITRAVADLYEGTRKVQAGNFSHRIPIRTKDQLSELAGSFNTMTEHIQHLIIEVKEKERLEHELQIAREVQSQLFPKEFPHLKTLELWGICQPARTVSGDYYDFVPLGPDRAALAIGDISGKGISAALLMAHIQSALRSQLTHRNSNGDEPAASRLVSPANILAVLNDQLYGSSAPEKYATFFLGLYTDADGQLVYTNAGHLPPMLVRRGQVQRLAGDGLPVGLFPGVHYDQTVVSLQSGDLLLGFTDGVTETPNRDGEEFGDRRLIELLVRHWDKPLDRIAGEISTAVAAWTGDLECHDDKTVVLARRL
jgi:phosphoserine phosphatase RsbU/P